MSDGFVTQAELDERIEHTGRERAELRRRVAELEETVERLQQELRLARSDADRDTAAPEVGD